MGLSHSYDCRSGSSSEHQMSVDRKPSQVTIRGDESLSGFFPG